MIDDALIAAARVSKAWPFQEAMKLVKRYPDGKPGGAPVLFETGYGPSGLPHIGTFQEVLRKRRSWLLICSFTKGCTRSFRLRTKLNARLSAKSAKLQ